MVEFAFLRLPALPAFVLPVRAARRQDTHRQAVGRLNEARVVYQTAVTGVEKAIVPTPKTKTPQLWGYLTTIVCSLSGP